MREDQPAPEYWIVFRSVPPIALTAACRTVRTSCAAAVPADRPSSATITIESLLTIRSSSHGRQNCHETSRLEFRPLTRRSRELENVHPGVRPIDDVDEAAIVDLDVVGLDGGLAALVRAGAHA